MAKRKSEHIKVAEKALGRELPPGAEVHHVDLDRKNNVPGNLVIMENHEEHIGLHIRLRAASGEKSWGAPRKNPAFVREKFSSTVPPETMRMMELDRLPGESLGQVIDRAVEALRKGEKI